MSPLGNQEGVAAPISDSRRVSPSPNAIQAALQVMSLGLRQQEQKNDDRHGCNDALMRPQVMDSTDVS